MANTQISTMLATTAVLALAACGGGSSAVNNNPIAVTPIQSQFTSNAKISAKQDALAVMRLDWDDRTSTIIPKTDFSIQKSSNGLISMVYDGKTYEFTTEHEVVKDDGSIAGYVFSDDENANYFALYGMNNALNEIYDEERADYAFLVEYMVLLTDRNKFAGDFGMAVLGTPSRTTALGNFTSETYIGGFRAEILAADVSNVVRGGRADRHKLDGNFTLIANISQNTISGTVTDIRTELFDQNVSQSQGRVSQTGSIKLNNGVITNTSFAGDVVLDQNIMDSLNLSALDATFKGALYGPNIEQAAGVLSGTGTRQNTDVNMIGGFSGNRE